MKIRPIQPAFRAFDKDERSDAEEKRIRMLVQLLCEMEIPASKIQFLKLKSQRQDILTWLKTNLGIYNSQHKNFNRANNLIDLLMGSYKK